MRDLARRIKLLPGSGHFTTLTQTYRAAVLCHFRKLVAGNCNRGNGLLTTALLIPALTGCSLSLKISDVVVTERLFSPDSSYVALTYYKDNGAMGESSSMTSVLKVTDTPGELTSGRLPCFNLSFYSCYYPDRWLDNKTLQVFLNERPFVKEGIPFDTTGVTVNGITCKVVPFDLSYSLSPLIEYFAFSDDRKKILAVYRYNRDLNISVIGDGDKLPKIGNIFTNTEISFNPIRYVKWNGDGIDMFLWRAKMFKKSDYLNRQTPCPVQFVDLQQLKDTLKGNDYGFYAPLYKDAQVDDLLNRNGILVKGVITESRWQKEEDKSLFYFEYEYEAKGQKFRSYFRVFKAFEKGADCQQGDSIIIKYLPEQPFVHTTGKNYSH